MISSSVLDDGPKEILFSSFPRKRESRKIENWIPDQVGDDCWYDVPLKRDWGKIITGEEKSFVIFVHFAAED